MDCKRAREVECEHAVMVVTKEREWQKQLRKLLGLEPVGFWLTKIDWDRLEHDDDLDWITFEQQWRCMELEGTSEEVMMRWC